jgi:hypothetical protein
LGSILDIFETHTPDRLPVIVSDHARLLGPFAPVTVVTWVSPSAEMVTSMSTSLLPGLFTLPPPAKSQAAVVDSLSLAYGSWEDLIRDEQLEQDRSATQRELAAINSKVGSVSPVRNKGVPCYPVLICL